MKRETSKRTIMAVLAVVALATVVACDDDYGFTKAEVCEDRCTAMEECDWETPGDGDSTWSSNAESCAESCEAEYEDTGDCGDEKLDRDHCLYSEVLLLDCDWEAAEDECAAEIEAYQDCTGPADDQNAA
jgi:hypothetical protein